MISRRFLVVTSVLLAAVMCSTVVYAQRPGGGRPGGGRSFSGRSMGGGTAIFSLMTRLLDIEKVQKEIDLLPEQLADIKKAQEASRSNRGGGGERPNFREMSEEERNEFFAKMRKQSETRQKELKKKVDEYLLPHQTERLREIAMQVAGVGALGDSEVVAKLKISDGQKEKMKTAQDKVREEVMAKMRSAFQGGGQGFDRNKIREQIAEIRKEAEGALTGALTDSQKSDWEKMKGKSFELTDEEKQQLSGFGGRGRGRGRPGGQGGQGGTRRRGRPAADDNP